MSDTRTQSTALDFATRTVFAPAQTDGSLSEISETLGELIAAFGSAQVSATIQETPALTGTVSGEDRVLQALRAFAVLIIDDTRPKLVAALVGKLARLELATGRPLKLEDLGRANGISKQAASKKMADLATRLGLPRPDSTPSTRLAHRLMNRRNYGHNTHQTHTTGLT